MMEDVYMKVLKLLADDGHYTARKKTERRAGYNDETRAQKERTYFFFRGSFSDPIRII